MRRPSTCENSSKKYRAIFDWHIPDIDQKAADRLILAEMRKTLDDVEKTLSR
jgi:hypothetical protein